MKLLLCSFGGPWAALLLIPCVKVLDVRLRKVANLVPFYAFMFEICTDTSSLSSFYTQMDALQQPSLPELPHQKVDVPTPIVAEGKTTTIEEALQAAKASKPSSKGSQISTVSFLFGFFAVLFIISYLIHKAGGPGAVEMAVDRFILRMTGRRLPGSVVDRNGAYSALPR